MAAVVPSVGLPDFAGLVAQVGPAVVNITSINHTPTPVVAGGDDDPFDDFLRRFGMPHPRADAPPERGEGSGFIIDSNGIILTNAHVVGAGDELTVRLTDRREFAAKVVGVDKRTDVAVLRIAAKGLPTVRIGNPDLLQPGQWVLAIGSPFGFDNSVTAGIVSAKARALPDENFTPFIQTDVAVNPGNSGGPLFNLAGEVVGINSQIYSRTGGYMGLSFAIPIDLVVYVKDQLVANGKVRRGRLGVTIQDVNQSLADSFGLDRPRGALVSGVEPGAPADRAGLEPGDVILALDNHLIDRSSELPARVARLAPGTVALLRVWRGRAERRLSAKIGELAELATPVVGAVKPAAGGRLGLAVRPLSLAEQRPRGLKGGVIIEEVTGPAAEAGLQPGDIILGVNGRRVNTVEQLREAAGGAQSVALLVQRGEVQLFVPLRPVR
jgi:serine protease Do